jgi:D-lactate dehydrogenase
MRVIGVPLSQEVFMISIILNEPWEAAKCTATWDADQLTLYPAGTTADMVDPATEVLSTFIHTKITAAHMDRLPNLRLIATRSTGFDHIDVAAATARKIAVCNVPAYGERTVAEYAMALLLAATRLVLPSTYRLQHDFSASVQGLRGVDIHGKTVGIVGTGRIGRNFGRMINGFSPHIIAYDVTPDLDWGAEVGATFVDLESLYRQADIISFHLPLFATTHHTFNMQTLALLKPGVFVVNTSRGGLIDSAALLAGLKQGIVRGAALDVVDHEELIGSQSDSPDVQVMKELLAHPHVIASAHNAFNTSEALERILSTTIDTINQHLTGYEPQYMVNA